MIEFDYHIKQVTAYAFYNGQVRGLVTLLLRGYLTPQEFNLRHASADMDLHKKLKATDDTGQTNGL